LGVFVIGLHTEREKGGEFAIKLNTQFAILWRQADGFDERADHLGSFRDCVGSVQGFNQVLDFGPVDVGQIRVKSSTRTFVILLIPSSR